MKDLGFNLLRKHHEVEDQFESFVLFISNLEFKMNLLLGVCLATKKCCLASENRTDAHGYRLSFCRLI